MAGGGLTATVGANADHYNGRLTGFVISVAIMAACGGLLFGECGMTFGRPGLHRRSVAAVMASQVHRQLQGCKLHLHRSRTHHPPLLPPPMLISAVRSPTGYDIVSVDGYSMGCPPALPACLISDQPLMHDQHRNPWTLLAPCAGCDGGRPLHGFLPREILPRDLRAHTAGSLRHEPVLQVGTEGVPEGVGPPPGFSAQTSSMLLQP